jgi:hypothetical protein
MLSKQKHWRPAFAGRQNQTQGVEVRQASGPTPGRDLVGRFAFTMMVQTAGREILRFKISRCSHGDLSSTAHTSTPIRSHPHPRFRDRILMSFPCFCAKIAPIPKGACDHVIWKKIPTESN